MGTTFKSLEFTPEFYKDAMKPQIGDEAYYVLGTFEAIAHPEKVWKGTVVHVDESADRVLVRNAQEERTLPIDAILTKRGLEKCADTNRNNVFAKLACGAIGNQLKEKYPKQWNMMADNFSQTLLARELCIQLGIYVKPDDMLDKCARALIQQTQKDFDSGKITPADGYMVP